jgi:hypothetical protein
MTTRPTASPSFATDATFTSGDESGQTPRLDPGAGFKAQGWYPNRRVPARWFNWLLGIWGDWLRYLAEKTDGIYSPLNYAGVGDESANDTTPIQDCFNAASAASGDGKLATVDLGGKGWRVTAKLACKYDVNVKNGRLVMDHATESFLEFSSAGAGLSTKAKWENVQVDYAQANTGTILAATVPGVGVVFDNCRFNDSGLCSTRLFNNSGGSDLSFYRCQGKLPLNGPGFRSDSGTLEIVGGRYQVPAGYADSMVEGTGGTHRLEGVHFVTSAATGGNATCVHVAGQKVRAYNCVFDDGAGNNNKAFVSALGAEVADLIEHDCEFRNIISYSFAAHLEEGCSVDLEPHGSDSTNGATATVPSLYRNYVQRFTAVTATAPTVTVDPPLFIGQTMNLMVANDGTTPWSGPLIFAGVLHQASDVALTNLGSSSTVRFCCTLTAWRYEGSLAWVMSNQKNVSLV